jgi:hypothetical protein
MPHFCIIPTVENRKKYTKTINRCDVRAGQSGKLVQASERLKRRLPPAE